MLPPRVRVRGRRWRRFPGVVCACVAGSGCRPRPPAVPPPAAHALGPRMTQRVWVRGGCIAHAGNFCNVAEHATHGRVCSRMQNNCLSHSARLHDMTEAEAEALGNVALPAGAQICYACRKALQRAKKAQAQTETCGGCGEPNKRSIGDMQSALWLGQGVRRCRTCRRHHERRKRTDHPVHSPGRSKSKKPCCPDTRSSVPRPPGGPKPVPPPPRKW